MAGDRAAGVVEVVVGRARGNIWAVLQQATAATLAWLLAQPLAGEHQPFFAPIAAVVALNTTLGGRGVQALRLLGGAVVGILVGSITLNLLGTHLAALPVGTFAAMIIVVLAGGSGVSIAQAASGAILTAGVPYGGVGGIPRLLDASIGTAVALLFSQVLFPTHPVRLLEQAQARLISEVRELLSRTTAVLGRASGNGAHACRC